MSRIIYISLILVGMFFQWCSLSAQPSISAVIPDICSPGMNIAMEILAPASEKGAFGTDGIYLNNRSDIIRVQTLIYHRSLLEDPIRILGIGHYYKIDSAYLFV